MASPRSSSPNSSRPTGGRRPRAGGASSSARASAGSAPGGQSSGGSLPGHRYRRTGIAFLLLALAVVTGLREWFGVSGAAGGLLHHIAAGPVGVLGVVVPLLLVAVGVAMLRVHRLATVHARIATGCLGVLVGLTGIIQVASGNPSLSAGLSPIESAGGILGWAVGYPLAVLFSSAGAIILFVLLIAFSGLVMSGRTVADLREHLAQRRGADRDDGGEDALATRMLDRLRSRRDPGEAPTATLDSYDGDEPFRSALETDATEQQAASRKRGSGRRRRTSQDTTRRLDPLDVAARDNLLGDDETETSVLPGPADEPDLFGAPPDAPPSFPVGSACLGHGVPCLYR